jgi:hypothetical protein
MPEVRYLRTDGHLPGTVTYLRDEEGQELFTVQPLGREELKQFFPCPDERHFARQILAEALQDNGALRLHFEEGEITIDWAR